MQYSAYYSPSMDKIVLIVTINENLIAISEIMGQWKIQKTFNFINSDYIFLGLL